MFLVKLNVPYEAAWDMDATDRLAHLIVLQEFEGTQKFDFDAMQFREVK